MNKLKSANESKINQLLRLAELCDSTQTDKRKYYMELAESLLLSDEATFEIVNEKYLLPPDCEHLSDFYNQYKDALVGNTNTSNYQHYVDFCEKNHIKPFEKLPFSIRMCKYFPLKAITKKDLNHKTVRVWISTVK